MLRAFSYGGGVQSTAALVLAAAGRIDFRTFVFANVGDDSEHPATLRYVRDVAVPYAAAQGLDVLEVQRTRRDGTPDTLYGLAMRSERSIPLPVRLAPSGALGNRSCTVDFKIKVVDRLLKERGASAENPAVVGIGISMDEVQRMRTDDPRRPFARLSYPLITLRMDRAACVRVIEDAGLPVPPKSSCYFCPFHSKDVWQKMRHEEPELFAKSVELERVMHDRTIALGRGHAYFSRKLRPLEQVTSHEVQGGLFETEPDDACNVFSCHT